MQPHFQATFKRIPKRNGKTKYFDTITSLWPKQLLQKLVGVVQEDSGEPIKNIINNGTGKMVVETSNYYYHVSIMQVQETPYQISETAIYEVMEE